MNVFLTLAFLFSMGSMLGWGIEVIFRRFFSTANPERRWINPGFLVGPCLPLYGFSLCALYLLASCERWIPIDNLAGKRIVLFLLMAVCVTAIEYLAGLIFIRGMKIKLWDYSDQWGNVQGIICPKFTVFWAILSAAYYFLIHPRILTALDWLSKNLAFSFCIGLFYGVFLIDFAYSAQLSVKIRRFAAENGVVVRFEELKAHIREGEERRREKARFLLSVCSSSPVAEQLRGYLEKHGAVLPHVKKPGGDAAPTTK